jgi:cysteine desulfurase / selenocysteine lyase
MFDKSADAFPVKNEFIYLLHCGIAPLFSKAHEKEHEISERQQDTGALLFSQEYEIVLSNLHEAAAELMRTDASNIAFVKNTSEGMSMIAGGYPFAPGDQIVVYTHEYPANYYPWKLQENRGAKVVLLPDSQIESPPASPVRPAAWSISELESVVTSRTKIVAVSHVQFTSGYAADLKELGDFCRTNNIDLVVDAAQSLGALPVYPEEMNISAVCASGWKWLLGPIGTGLMYTSPEFREKLGSVLVGAELMQQGTDYLDHRWNPHHTATRFEYSTSPLSLAAALAVCVRQIPLLYGVESIRRELFRLQECATKIIDKDLFSPLIHPVENRSGILSVVCKRKQPDEIVEELMEQKVVCSARGGYLRLAPHFYNTEEEIERAIDILNTAGR